MPQYLLALYNDPVAWKQRSPEEMQNALEKYMAWGKRHYVRGGHRLAPDAGRVLRAKNGTPHVADGPYSETKEILAGIYLIEPNDYQEAVERSLDNPRVEFGGTVELRELFSM